MEEKNWGAEPWRKPQIGEDDTEVFSECGRILDKTDYRSHWIVLVKPRFGGYSLLVKHGGGQERIELGNLHHYRGNTSRIIQAMEAMDTDARYLMLYTFLDIHTDSKRKAQYSMRTELTTAFVEGRMKKRKVKGQNAYKVHIDPAPSRQEVEDE